MRNKHVLIAVVITYLAVSFVPALSLGNVIRKAKGGGQ